MRINHQGAECTAAFQLEFDSSWVGSQDHVPDSSSWQPLATVVPCTGKSWSGQITGFKTNPIDCTLLAQWDDGYSDPWLILRDLKPTEANILWYGFRSWIERQGRALFPQLVQSRC